MAALSDVDIKKELGKNIVIEEFNEESLTPIGYDLRIGAAFSPDMAQEAVYIEGSSVVIKAGKMLQIICKAFVWVSARILASIHSRGSLSVEGLVLNSTTIDPNWSGQMALALFNFSDHDIEIKIGDRFATVIFYYCSSPTAKAPTSRAIEGLQTSAFSSYEHSSEISRIRSEFEKKKQKAQTHPSYIMRGILQKVLGDVHGIFKPRTGIVILLVISMIALVALPLGFYSVLQVKFGWGDYNFAYFLSNCAICVSLLVALNKSN